MGKIKRKREREADELRKKYIEREKKIGKVTTTRKKGRQKERERDKIDEF